MPCAVGESCPTGVNLVRWYTELYGQRYNIDFKSDYKGFAPNSPSYEAHKDTFNIPKECSGNIFNCGKQAAEDPRMKLQPWMPVRIEVDEKGNRINWSIARNGRIDVVKTYCIIYIMNNE